MHNKQISWDDPMPLNCRNTPEYKALLEQLEQAQIAAEKCGCKSCWNHTEYLMMDLMALEDEEITEYTQQEMQEDKENNNAQ